MILDVMFKDESLERIVLPGSTLAYGHSDTLSKGVALLWALFLVAGPTEADVRLACDHVRSLTTDFGVEMHILEVPDILPAFFKWIGGTPLDRCAQFVNNERRLWRRALRVAGWSHTLGGIMKSLAEKNSD